MDIVIGKEAFLNTKRPRVGSHPGQSCLHGLLHHLADLSGHGEATFTLHHIGFDEQNVAARWRPGQTHNHSRSLGTLGDFAFATNFDSTEELLNDLLGNDQLLSLTFRQATRLLTADGADVAFKISDTSLARVVADQIAHCIVRTLNLLGRYAIFFNLPRHE